MSPGRRSVHRRILALALPTMAALAAEPLFGLADTAFVARLGTRALASLALGAALISLIAWLFNFLISSTTATVADALGRRDEFMAAARVRQVESLAFRLGLLAIVACFLLEGTLFGWMGDSGTLRETGAVYFRLRVLALPLVFMSFAAMGALRGMQRMRELMRIALTATCLNLLLDPLLIFGLPGLGLPGLGLAGAGLATLLAQVFCLLQLRRTLRRIRPQWFRHPAPFPATGIRCSLSPVQRDLFLRTLFLLGSLTFATRLAGGLGEISLAAHQVALQLWLVFSFLVDGFAVAGQALAGDFQARGRRNALRLYGDRLLLWGLALGLFFSLLLTFGAAILPALLLPDPAPRRLLAAVYPLILLMQPLNGLTFVLDGIHIGRLDTAFLRWQLFIAGPLVFVPVALLLTWAGLGLPGLWLSLTLFLLVRFAFNLLRWLQVRGGHR